MREQYETLALSEPAGQVLQVRLNRPNVANAMNTQMGLGPEFVVIQTAGHWVQYDAPTTFNAALTTILDAARTRR